MVVTVTIELTLEGLPSLILLVSYIGDYPWFINLLLTYSSLLVLRVFRRLYWSNT